MKLLLDQGLPLSASTLLRDAGIDAVHTTEIGYALAGDADILEFAVANGRIVATLDADFHMLLALTGARTPSVIRIRVEGLRGRASAQLLQSVLVQCDEELTHGALVTVQPGRIRIRRLPLLRETDITP